MSFLLGTITMKFVFLELDRFFHAVFVSVLVFVNLGLVCWFSFSLSHIETCYYKYIYILYIHKYI